MAVLMCFTCSGAGKTTLLDAIQDRPSRGTETRGPEVMERAPFGVAVAHHEGLVFEKDLSLLNRPLPGLVCEKDLS